MENKTIAEIVAQNFQTAAIFNKYGIDFCCGGKKSLKNVCDEKSLNITTLIDELNRVSTRTNNAENYNAWSLTFMIDYIVQVHHQYIYDSIPIIKQYADKVTSVHGHKHPELEIIRNLFYEVAHQLETHLPKEEQILFPFIKKAEANNDVHSATIGNIQNPIKMMEIEHEHVGDIFHKIASLTNHYKIPNDACNTYQVYFLKLEEFDNDLHKHVHLENNILFPKAISIV